MFGLNIFSVIGMSFYFVVSYDEILRYIYEHLDIKGAFFEFCLVLLFIVTLALLTYPGVVYILYFCAPGSINGQRLPTAHIFNIIFTVLYTWVFLILLDWKKNS